MTGHGTLQKKSVATKTKGVTQSPILTFKEPKNTTWVANMENHALKMGKAPKVKTGKASIKKPTYPSQFKAHNKKK